MTRKRRKLTHNPYIDDEAHVSDGEDEEHEEHDQSVDNDPFLDDGEPLGEPSRTSYNATVLSPSEEAREMRAVAEEFIRRHDASSVFRTEDEDDEYEGSYWVLNVPANQEKEYIKRLSSSIYARWIHDVIPHRLPGRVTVCCDTLQDLRHVCSKLPLPCNATFMPVEDRSYSLQEPAETEPRVGQFVRITKMPQNYRHDLAILYEVCSHDTFHLLVVPRMAINMADIPPDFQTWPSRRRRAHRFHARLFDRTLFQEVIAATLKYTQSALQCDESDGVTTYTLRQCTFRNGFVVVTCTSKDFKVEHNPQLFELVLFAEANYSPFMAQISATISRASKRSVWLPGDKVRVVEGALKGLFGELVAVDLDTWIAEVTISIAAKEATSEVPPEQLQQSIGLDDLRRYFRPGDNVQVAEGRNAGRFGIVVVAEDNEVVFVEDKMRDEVHASLLGYQA